MQRAWLVARSRDRVVLGAIGDKSTPPVFFLFRFSLVPPLLPPSNDATGALGVASDALATPVLVFCFFFSFSSTFCNSLSAVIQVSPTIILYISLENDLDRCNI